MRQTTRAWMAVQAAVMGAQNDLIFRFQALQKQELFENRKRYFSCITMIVTSSFCACVCAPCGLFLDECSHVAERNAREGRCCWLFDPPGFQDRNDMPEPRIRQQSPNYIYSFCYWFHNHSSHDFLVVPFKSFEFARHKFAAQA